jgi:hypothetical protein
VDGWIVQDHQFELLPTGEVFNDGIYALGRKLLPTLDEDGVVPILGRNSMKQGRRAYRLTGTVGRFPADAGGGEDPADGHFLLTVTKVLRFVGHLEAGLSRHITSGSRISLECSLSLAPGCDWALYDLPEDWSSDWRVLETRELKWGFGMPDYVLDLEPADQ